MAAGVVAGELVAALVSPALSPMTAVGGAVIDAVPPAVKDWAVAVFGTADKLALLVGMGLAIAALAALAGLLEWRRRFAGFAVIGIFGVVGLVAVLGRAQVTGNAMALPLLAAATGILVLRWLMSRLRDWTTSATAGERPAPDAAPDRRTDRRTPDRRTRPAPVPPGTGRGSRRRDCWRSPCCRAARSGCGCQ